MPMTPRQMIRLLEKKMVFTKLHQVPALIKRCGIR